MSGPFAILGSTYILLTVSGLGQMQAVHYPTKHACEEAMSVAQTGYTLEEKYPEWYRAYTLERHNRFKWYAAHPPRAPVSADEQRILTQDWPPFGYVGGGLLSKADNAPGLVQDQPTPAPGFYPVDQLLYGFPLLPNRDPRDTERADCVEDKP